MRLILDFRANPGVPLDASPLVPAYLLSMSLSEVSRLKIDSGRNRIPLGDLCSIRLDQEGEDCVIFQGTTNCLHRSGWKMNAGRLVVLGSAGRWAGAGMSGGEVFVDGNAGDNAGVGMSGGILRITGSAGERVGGAKAGDTIGMNGGVILMSGNTGDFLGERMRRGLIYCAGNAGKYCGIGMLAGSILAAGRLDKGAGMRMRRGSIAAGSSEPLLPGFHKSGRMEFGWIRIACSWLQKMGAKVPVEWKTGRFQRFSGHDLEMNKGEILTYDPDQ